VEEALASQTTSTEWACGANPVPESGTDSMVVPLLMSARLPDTVPEALGLNTTETSILCAGARLMGVVIPVLKPDPVILFCVMFAVAVPLFVIFTVSVTGVLSA
jgi:hypothetical protein